MVGLVIWYTIMSIMTLMIPYCAALEKVEHRSDIELTTTIPFLDLMGELNPDICSTPHSSVSYGVHCKYLVKTGHVIMALHYMLNELM